MIIVNNMNTYIIALQNEDKTIECFEYSINNYPGLFDTLKEELLELKTFKDVQEEYASYFHRSFFNRNELYTVFEEKSWTGAPIDGIFIFIDHFWLYADGNNLVPLDSIK